MLQGSVGKFLDKEDHKDNQDDKDDNKNNDGAEMITMIMMIVMIMIIIVIIMIMTVTRNIIYAMIILNSTITATTTSRKILPYLPDHLVFTKKFRYQKWRNPHVCKQYGSVWIRPM